MTGTFFWFDASNAASPVFHRYMKKSPRVYFGDVYRQQGTGRIQSRIYRNDGDLFKIHKTIADAKAYIEQRAKE